MEPLSLSQPPAGAALGASRSPRASPPLLGTAAAPLRGPPLTRASAHPAPSCRERLRDALCVRMVYGHAPFRFAALALVVSVVVAGYFSYDLPGITSEHLKATMGLSNSQLGLLFSVYAFPNAVVPLFSGAYYNAVGAWRGVLGISAVIAAGVGVVAAGVAANSFPLLLAGRVLYGLGGESVYVGVDVLATDWFKDHELGLAYGLIQSAGQAGSFAAFYGVPLLMTSPGAGGIVGVYALGCALSVAALACLAAAHELEDASVWPPGHKEENGEAVLDKEDDTNEMCTGDEEQSRGEDEDNVDEDAAAVSDAVGTRTSSVDGDDACDAEAPQPITAARPTHNSRTPPGGAHRGSALRRLLTSRVGVRLGAHHLPDLPWQFYVVLASIAAYSCCFYTFLAFGNDYLQSRYAMHAEDSGRLVGAVSIASCVLSPLAGWAMDQRGGRPFVACGALACAAAAFAVLGFGSAALPPVAPIAFAGVCYAVLPSALYPMIADVVPEEAFTQVYAITNAAVNALLMVTFYAAGALSETAIDEGGGGGGGRRGADYTGVFAMLVAWCACGTAATGALSVNAYREWLRERAEAAVAAAAEEEEGDEEEADEDKPGSAAAAAAEEGRLVPTTYAVKAAGTASSLAWAGKPPLPTAADAAAQTPSSGAVEQLPTAAPPAVMTTTTARRTVTLAPQATVRTPSGRHLTVATTLPSPAAADTTAGEAATAEPPARGRGGGGRARRHQASSPPPLPSQPQRRAKSAEPTPFRGGGNMRAPAAAAAAGGSAGTSGSRPIPIPAARRHVLPTGRALMDARYRSGFRYGALGGGPGTSLGGGVGGGSYSMPFAPAGTTPPPPLGSLPRGDTLLSRSLPRAGGGVGANAGITATGGASSSLPTSAARTAAAPTTTSGRHSRHVRLASAGGGAVRGRGGSYTAAAATASAGAGLRVDSVSASAVSAGVSDTGGAGNGAHTAHIRMTPPVAAPLPVVDATAAALAGTARPTLSGESLTSPPLDAGFNYAALPSTDA